MLQEALSNVRQHSGASAVAVALREDDDGLCMEIRDDGHGFDPGAVQRDGDGQSGIGVVGMRERLRLLGGRLELESAPGGPTVVRAVLPRWTRAVYALILIGVPTGTRSLRRRIASFATRMQPCETACPSSEGVFVPWIPTMPPPGHSLSFE